MIKKLTKILIISLVTLTVFAVNATGEERDRQTVYTEYFDTRAVTPANVYNTVLVYVRTEDGVEAEDIGLNVPAYTTPDYYCVGHYRTVGLLPWTNYHYATDSNGITDDEDIRTLLADTPFSDSDFGSNPSFTYTPDRTILNSGFDINRVTFEKMAYKGDGGLLGNSTKAFTDSHWHLNGVADKYKLTVTVNGQSNITYVKSGDLVDLSEYEFLPEEHFDHWYGYDVENDSFIMPKQDVNLDAVLLSHKQSGTLAYVPEIPKSCSSIGWLAHYECGCEKVFLDENAENEVDTSDLLIEAGHDFTLYGFDDNDYVHFRVCEVCYDPDRDSFEEHVYDENGVCYCGYSYMDLDVVVVGNDSWYTNSNDNLIFKSSAQYDKFDGVVVDDVTVSQEDYLSYEGSTYVELLPDYLRSLSLGEHTLTMRFMGGEGSVKFYIKKPVSFTPPKTGIDR